MKLSEIVKMEKKSTPVLNSESAMLDNLEVIGYNEAIDQLSSLSVEVNFGELTAIIREHLPCDHHAAQNCRCDLKWAKVSKAISQNLHEIIKICPADEKESK